jgi:hypothetical protein
LSPTVLVQEQGCNVSVIPKFLFVGPTGIVNHTWLACCCAPSWFRFIEAFQQRIALVTTVTVIIHDVTLEINDVIPFVSPATFSQL